MNFFFLFSLILCLVQSTIYASSEPSDKKENYEERKLKSDFKQTVSYLLKGSLLQFTQKSNLYYGAGAGVSLWYSFEHDDRLLANAMQKGLPFHVNFTGDAGIALNFPILSAGFYYYGRKSKDNHLIQFTMEYTATMYLTLVETGLLSYVDVHDRPNSYHLSFWEKEFRGDSSFPSGHIVPYAALFFKTLQFYGPYYAAVPLVLTIWSSMQRVREGRHYISDVVGAFFLTAFASEGVRAAAKYKKNHAFYKFIFEHNVRLTVLRYKSAVGPKLVYEF